MFINECAVAPEAVMGKRCGVTRGKVAEPHGQPALRTWDSLRMVQASESGLFWFVLQAWQSKRRAGSTLLTRKALESSSLGPGRATFFYSYIYSHLLKLALSAS